jgi:hypothetical protein
VGYTIFDLPVSVGDFTQHSFRMCAFMCASAVPVNVIFQWHAGFPRSASFSPNAYYIHVTRVTRSRFFPLLLVRYSFLICHRLAIFIPTQPRLVGFLSHASGERFLPIAKGICRNGRDFLLLLLWGGSILFVRVLKFFLAYFCTHSCFCFRQHSFFFRKTRAHMQLYGLYDQSIM